MQLNDAAQRERVKRERKGEQGEKDSNMGEDTHFSTSVQGMHEQTKNSHEMERVKRLKEERLCVCLCAGMKRCPNPHPNPGYKQNRTGCTAMALQARHDVCGMMFVA